MEKKDRQLENFKIYLKEQEKSKNTVDKYVGDARRFLRFAGLERGEKPQKEHVMKYKEYLLEHYQVSSANSMIAALNCYLKFIGRGECCIQAFRIQRQIFRSEKRELNRREYQRLVEEAQRRGKGRLSGILQTISATGIRISELNCITVEALGQRMARICSKGKIRIILLPESLVRMLREYCREMRIQKGCIFITRSGRPVDRRNVWAEIKGLCRGAGVERTKAFPHNLRHLFARCYYEKEKDLVRLADYLGHSSVETTRRYTMISTMEACLHQLELGLLVKKRKRRRLPVGS